MALGGRSEISAMKNSFSSLRNYMLHRESCSMLKLAVPSTEGWKYVSVLTELDERLCRSTPFQGEASNRQHFPGAGGTFNEVYVCIKIMKELLDLARFYQQNRSAQSLRESNVAVGSRSPHQREGSSLEKEIDSPPSVGFPPSATTSA